MTVTLTWLSEASQTQPEGGDVIGVTFASIIFDGTSSERYVADASATEHPVEMGADIADHIRIGLRQVTLDVVVSAHPGPSSAANVAMEIPYGFVGWDGEASSRPGTVRQQLEQLRVAGTEVEIETPVGVYESMLILGVEESRTVDTGDAYRATITTREFRRVSTQEVDAPAPRVERGRRTSDRGTQQTQSASADAPVAPSAALGLLRTLNPTNWGR